VFGAVVATIMRVLFGFQKLTMMRVMTMAI